MLNFKEWLKLQEGLFTIPSSQNDLLAIIMPLFEDQLKPGVKSRAIKQLVDLHKTKGLFKLSPKDDDIDIIKVEPLNSTKELPSLDKFSKLPTFEGATIHYGLKFVPKMDYKTKLIDLSKVAIMNKLEKDLAKYPHLKELIPKIDQIDDIIAKSNYNLNQAAKTIGVPANYLSDLTRIRDSIEQFEMLKKGAPALGEKNAIRYLNAVQSAFMKILKDKDKDPVVDEFIDMAVDNYVRINPNKYYDYIVYPESSGHFNQKLVTKFIEAYNKNNPNIQAIQGFAKVPAERIKIDTSNLYDIYGKDKAGKITQAYDFMSRTRGPRAGKKAQIKYVPQEMRPFVRQWEKSPEAKRSEGVNFKKKNILLVDDNINSSGTFQAIHKILSKEGPRKIDIYTPLYVEFYS
jgi:hypothetical protein